MNKKGAIFHKFSHLDGVYIAQSGKLWCTAIRLDDHGFCLFSPLPGLKQENFASIGDLGEVSVLLAPNHFHNRGIADHVQRFSSASLISSSEASPRLKKQTGFSFEGMEILSKRLPPHIRILAPKGLKTGEVWLEIKDKQSPTLIVCDAFTSIPSKAGEFSEHPCLLGTFPKYGVQDSDIYKRWAKKHISQHAPTHLISCHGKPVFNNKLNSLLHQLLDEEL